MGSAAGKNAEKNHTTTEEKIKTAQNNIDKKAYQKEITEGKSSAVHRTSSKTDDKEPVGGEQHSKDQLADRKAKFEETIKNLKMILTKVQQVPLNKLISACQRMATLQEAEGNTFPEPKTNVMDKRTQKKREKSKLIFKLSEMASHRLRANNAAITDLSDPNRATKLSERYSELYDNEWTDVFELLTVKAKLSEREAIDRLRDIFKTCCGVCENAASDQRLQFLRCLKRLPDDSSQNIETCSPALHLRLQEFQKLTSDYPIMYIRQICTKRVTENEKNTIAKKIFSEKHGLAFINKAVDVCWHSRIQIPQLAFVFEPSIELPATLFKHYTASGTELDYVVWPAMLLHEDGPILFKGIAQFKEKAEAIKENPNSNVEETAEGEFNIKQGQGKPSDSDWL